MSAVKNLAAIVDCRDHGVDPYLSIAAPLPLAHADTDLSMLPAPLALDVLQSGILDKGGDFSWFHNKRLIEVLMKAHAAHGGKVRKNGGESRNIHEIKGVYRAMNMPEVAVEQRKHGLPSDYVALGIGRHDIDENYFESFRDRGEIYDDKAREATRMHLRTLINDPCLSDRLEWECDPFMTDDPKLKNKARILAQKDKAARRLAQNTLTPFQQFWRMLDKLDHVVSDAHYCTKRVAELKITGTQDQWRVFRRQAIKAREKAKMKSFIFDMPLAHLVAPEYHDHQKIIDDIIRHDIPRVQLKTTFKALAQDMMRHVIKVTSDASRSWTNFSHQLRHGYGL